MIQSLLDAAKDDKEHRNKIKLIIYRFLCKMDKGCSGGGVKVL